MFITYQVKKNSGARGSEESMHWYFAHSYREAGKVKQFRVFLFTTEVLTADNVQEIWDGIYSNNVDSGKYEDKIEEAVYKAYTMPQEVKEDVLEHIWSSSFFDAIRAAFEKLTGLALTSETDYERGFKAGQSKGYTSGYETGFKAGNTKGRVEGYNQGFNDGCNAKSYKTGYDEGYKSGFDDGQRYNTQGRSYRDSSQKQQSSQNGNAGRNHNPYQSFYDILGIKVGATLRELKKAFRTLSKKYHPDSGGKDANAEKFRAVVEAYEKLKDIISA